MITIAIHGNEGRAPATGATSGGGYAQSVRRVNAHICRRSDIIGTVTRDASSLRARQLMAMATAAMKHSIIITDRVMCNMSTNCNLCGDGSMLVTMMKYRGRGIARSSLRR